MEKLDLKEFEKSLELAFLAGKNPVNKSFKKWFNAFMNNNGYMKIEIKPTKIKLK